MATSGDILNTMQGIQGQLNPLLGDQYQAPDFFKNGLNQAFNYNLPLLRQGAALSADAYTLPGKLMDQYNQEFGGTFGGASGTARLNSVLGRLGNQFSLVDLVTKLADQQGANIKDMAGNLTDQYGMMIKGLQDKYNMNLPIFQTLKNSEDAAASRSLQAGLAAQAREDAKNQALQFQKFLETPRPTTTTASSGIQPGAIGSKPGGGFLYPSAITNPVPSYSYGGSSTPLSNSYGIVPGQMSSPVRR